MQCTATTIDTCVFRLLKPVTILNLLSFNEALFETNDDSTCSTIDYELTFSIDGMYSPRLSSKSVI